MGPARALAVAALALILSGVLVIASTPDVHVGPAPVEPPARPERIVAVGLHQDEVALALAPERVVGVDRFADDREASFVVDEARAIEARVTVSSESILRLDPDLVLLPGWVDRELEAAITRAGVAVHREPVVTSVEDIEVSVRRMGVLLDARAEADALVAELHRALDGLPSPTRRPSALLLSATGTSPGRDTLFAELVARAGGRIAIERSGIVPLSMEAVLALDPEVIFLDGYVADGRARALGGNSHLAAPLRSHLRASRAHRVHSLSAREANTTSHHVIETLRTLAEHLSR
jgi:ABC-type Fe3+-hydroxamate transport system substrate-binding protein